MIGSRLNPRQSYPVLQPISTESSLVPLHEVCEGLGLALATGLRFGRLESVVGKSAEGDLRIRGKRRSRKYLVTFDLILSGISAG